VICAFNLDDESNAFYIFDASLTHDDTLDLVVQTNEEPPPEPRTFLPAKGHIANIVTSGDSLMTLSGTFPGTAQDSPFVPPGPAITVAVDLALHITNEGSGGKFFEMLGSLNGEPVRAAGFISYIEPSPGGGTVNKKRGQFHGEWPGGNGGVTFCPKGQA
jgi:hypothetical protein